MGPNTVNKLADDTKKLLASVFQISKNPAQLWSTGKDSTLMLYLVKEVFGKFPWPVIHIDTGKKPDEVYKFRDWLAKEWQIPLSVIKNKELDINAISPKVLSRYECCTLLKTDALKQEVIEKSYDALILSIRHDEHYVRGMEDLMSLRDEHGNWQYYGKFGGFGLTAPKKDGIAHLRIHPILPWTERDVWEYTLTNKLPVNPLYFSKNGERYRSLGCKCCTQTVKSDACTVKQILENVEEYPGIERAGRVQDKESNETMLVLRSMGYM